MAKEYVITVPAVDAVIRSADGSAKSCCTDLYHSGTVACKDALPVLMLCKNDGRECLRACTYPWEQFGVGLGQHHTCHRACWTLDSMPKLQTGVGQ